MTNRQTYVNTIKSWVGKKESNGTHKEIIDIYNSYKPHPRGYKVKYTDEWCAATVSAAAIKSGNTDIIPIECSCGQMIALAQNMGIWVENDAYVPAAGDIIMYYWKDNGKGDCKGWPNHVGVVESVTNNNIKVVEGNINNAVGYRNIKVNAKTIRGFITPKFAADAPAASYFPKYSGTSNSIVDALKSLKIDSSFSYRKKIANTNGTTLYVGTATQNIKLLTLLKQGKLIKP